MRERNICMKVNKTVFYFLLVVFAVFFLKEYCIAASVAGTHKKTSSPASLICEGKERTYRIYVPASCPKIRTVPLVIVLHGGGGTAEGTEKMMRYGFNVLADKEGFIVVYPGGIGKHWNDRRGDVDYPAHKQDIDDVGFISALIDKLVKENNVDARRVYVTGISNGAMMSLRLAGELAGKLAAVAPVDGQIPLRLYPAYAPSEPLSLLLMCGTKDPLVPFEGGDVHFYRKKLGKVVSVAETVSLFVKHNGCKTVPLISKGPDTDPSDGTLVRKEYYPGGKNGTEVILYAIENGGHTWPGGKQYLPESIIGKTCKDINACAVIWEFFKGHPKK
jgi:polyhydroxybutyrate depolymerase